MWNNGQRITVSNSYVSGIGTEGNHVSVQIEGLLTGSEILTSGTMYLFAVHKDFPGDTIRTSVVNHAAPVILHAQLAPAGNKANDVYVDTLTVTFSEKVDNISTSKPFTFLNMPDSIQYSMTMKNSAIGASDKQVFYVSSYDGS